MKNPFPITGYHGPEYFCDRKDELKQFRDAVFAGRHTTVLALRRMGKTALLKHFFQSLSSRQFHLVYADLMPTMSLKDLNNELLSALVRAFPEKTTMGRKIWQWVKSLRPTLTFDPYTGLPTISVSIEQLEENFRTIADLLKLMDESGKKTVIALDEFQQITQYPERQTEAWLRAQIQQLNNTVFIFSGSQQTILQEMFLSAKRPFYASSQLLALSYIANDAYVLFIQQHFATGKKEIGEREIEILLTWCRGHTYYVQTLCNRLYGRSEQAISESIIRQEMHQLLREQEPLYFTYRDLMTGPQWNLLRSIAKEDKLYAPTASAFIRKHRLGGAATIKRSLATLLGNEMVFQATDVNGKRYYQVYDVFLSRWLEILP